MTRNHSDFQARENQAQLVQVRDQTNHLEEEENKGGDEAIEESESPIGYNILIDFIIMQALEAQSA